MWKFGLLIIRYTGSRFDDFQYTDNQERKGGTGYGGQRRGKSED